jgi:uncharacterized cupredoxin-like copper-binding protein
MSKRRNLFITGTVLGLALIAFFAIVAWQASTSAPAGGNTQVRVTEADMSLKLDRAAVPAGKVTFVVINSDKVKHEAVLLKTDQAPNALVMLSDENKVDEEASAENVGEVEVEAGATGTVTMDLTPGKYVLICNMDEHYKAGMYSAFEVTAPTAALIAH